MCMAIDPVLGCRSGGFGCLQWGREAVLREQSGIELLGSVSLCSDTVRTVWAEDGWKKHVS